MAGMKGQISEMGFSIVELIITIAVIASVIALALIILSGN